MNGISQSITFIIERGSGLFIFTVFRNSADIRPYVSIYLVMMYDGERHTKSIINLSCSFLVLTVDLVSFHEQVFDCNVVVLFGLDVILP